MEYLCENDGACEKNQRYEIIGRLGEGAFGEVKLGMDSLTGEKIGLKYIRVASKIDGIPKAVFREVQSLQLLSNQNVNIVRLVDMFPDELTLCLVFEFLPSDLAEVISKASSFLPQSHVKCFAQMILDGLAFCHTNKIVHRDIKPSNILLSSTGQVKIADFGLARTITSTDLDGSLSHQVATRMYRAPELLFASRRYSFAVDVWSAGAVIAELFTLTPIFPGNNDIDQIYRVFQVMGSATVECWPDVGDLPDFGKVSFPLMKPMPFEILMPHAEPEDIAFLQTLLVLDPSKRATAAAAARSRYFCDHPVPSPLSALHIPLRAIPS